MSLRHEGNDGMNTMKASDKLGTYYYLIAYTLPVNGQPVQLSQVRGVKKMVDISLIEAHIISPNYHNLTI